jgi:hypothetical protein
MPHATALISTDDMRDCILAAIRRLVRRMGVSTAATELPLHEVNVRRRLERGRASDWSVADLAALMAYERDELSERSLLDAVCESDGRDLEAVDPADAERSVRELSRGFATELAVILERLDRDGLNDREAADTADDLERLLPLAHRTLRVLRARRTRASRRQA